MITCSRICVSTPIVLLHAATPQRHLFLQLHYSRLHSGATSSSRSLPLMSAGGDQLMRRQALQGGDDGALSQLAAEPALLLTADCRRSASTNAAFTARPHLPIFPIDGEPTSILPRRPIPRSGKVLLKLNYLWFILPTNLKFRAMPHHLDAVVQICIGSLTT